MRSRRCAAHALAGGAMIALALVTLSLPPAPLSAAVTSPGAPPGRLRHEDPAAVGVTADPTAVFEWYLGAVRLFGALRFRDGRRAVLRLERASVPAEVGALIGEINRLLIKEGSILEASDAWLREAARALAAGDTAAAQRILRELAGYVRRGDVLFADLVEELESLAERTRLMELPADSPQRQAYEELRRAAARLRALLAASRVAISTPATVEAFAGLLPFLTRLEIADPGPAYPGRSVVIRGEASEQPGGPPSGRRVRLWLDGRLLEEAPLGRFSVRLMLPADFPKGPHLISARVDALGRYLGASAARTLMVGGLSPELRLMGPAYGLAPGRLSLTGDVTSPLGPVGGLVVAHLGRAVGGAVLDQTGMFRVEIRVGGSLDLVGPQVVRVEVVPREPWHATSSAARSIFIINVANLGALALLLPAAAAGFARRRRSRAGSWDVQMPAAGLPAPAAAGAGPRTVPAPAAMLAGEAGPVRSIALLYVQAVRLVETRLGVRASGEMTMREFLERVTSALGSGVASTLPGGGPPSLPGGTPPSPPGGAFRALTMLVERAVYSAHRPGDEDVRWAEALVAEIISEAGGDAAR